MADTAHPAFSEVGGIAFAPPGQDGHSRNSCEPHCSSVTGQVNRVSSHPLTNHIPLCAELHMGRRPLLSTLIETL